MDGPGGPILGGNNYRMTGFLSFVRLIGSVNFKKHLAEFILCRPRALYMSLTQNDENRNENRYRADENLSIRQVTSQVHRFASIRLNLFKLRSKSI